MLGAERELDDSGAEAEAKAEGSGADGWEGVDEEDDPSPASELYHARKPARNGRAVYAAVMRRRSSSMSCVLLWRCWRRVAEIFGERGEIRDLHPSLMYVSPRARRH